MKASNQTTIGEKGIALIALRVGEMGHLWHPTSGVDSGIDGEIELRDTETGQVRNFRIGVQSKATEGSGGARPRSRSCGGQIQSTSSTGLAPTSP
jgi:hypothetical protein